MTKFCICLPVTFLKSIWLWRTEGNKGILGCSHKKSSWQKFRICHSFNSFLFNGFIEGLSIELALLYLNNSHLTDNHPVFVVCLHYHFHTRNFFHILTELYMSQSLFKWSDYEEAWAGDCEGGILQRGHRSGGLHGQYKQRAIHQHIILVIRISSPDQYS